MRAFILAMLMLLAPAALAETVTFRAADGLEVTADLYRPEGPAEAAIVLFHMAGSSRGEYAEIGPMLAARGYLALAVDQRSGDRFGGVRNETVRRAGGGKGYMEAIPDLDAAMVFARETLGAGRVAALGSSYSAALALALAGGDDGFADAVMAFSPGEYFANPAYVRDAAAGLTVPAFVTSAKGEMGQWRAIFNAIPGPKSAFLPAGPGRHGAPALTSAEGPEYWGALEAFLAKRFPPR